MLARRGAGFKRRKLPEGDYDVLLGLKRAKTRASGKEKPGTTLPPSSDPSMPISFFFVGDVYTSADFVFG